MAVAKRTRHSRAGSVVMEAVLVLPILALVALAAIQYGEMVVYEQAVTAAANEGAREAAKGADADQVSAVVATMLGPYGLTVGQQSGVRVDIDPMSATRGDMTVPAASTPALGTPPQGRLARDEVRVTVQVMLASARVPQILSRFGIDRLAARFRASAIATRQ